MTEEIKIAEVTSGVENVNIKDSEQTPLTVTYCSICHFPFEYCDISHTVLFKKQSHFIEPTKSESEKTTQSENGEEKPMTKQEKKKAKESYISIELSKRGKRKFVTTVFNLEKFGLNLKDVAKLFSKKFACSSTVTKEDNGMEGITLTGEFGYEIVEFLTGKFPEIKASMCKIKEPKKK